LPVKLHLVGVDDDDMVAAIDVRGEARLVLAAQDVGDDRTGEAADDQAVGIDQMPFLFDLGRLWPTGWSSSAPSWMKAYVRQCAIELSCRQLARVGRFLMLEGFDEASKPDLERARRARRILSLMMTSGLYDGAGEFAYRVGLPAKSGIGGGILAIAPNTASIAVWSPGLDESGNSKLGTLALEMLTDRLDWSSFGKIKTLQE
jgi:hypothetical protein